MRNSRKMKKEVNLRKIMGIELKIQQKVENGCV